MNTYLGDAVYASDEIIPGYITLTTGSHHSSDASNIIHLDEPVLKALVRLHERIQQEKRDNESQAIISLLPEHLRSKAGIFSLNQIDIDNLEHDEALEVMRALNAGRWQRKESGAEGKLDYIAEINGWTVRLWAAGPPDSCRVIEEEYEIPASKGVRKRLVCSKASEPTDESTTDEPF